MLDKEEERSFNSSSFSVFLAKQKSDTLLCNMSKSLEKNKSVKKTHLKSDQKLGQVVVELRPFLQVAF